MVEAAATVTPSITFAIPYYRNVAYLLEAVASVRAQTHTDWELVIVDDAGPDPADEQIAALGDSRIRYVRNATNLGLAGNWNECIRLASAPLVTILHADDRLLPDYAAAVLAAARVDPPVAAVFTDAVIIDGEGNPARSLPDFVKRFARRPPHNHDLAGDEGLASILANNYVMCPTLCYRKDVIGADPFDHRWVFVLDIDHVTRLLLDGHRLRGVRMNLYEYRRHAHNQTTALTADASRFGEELEFYREVAGTALANGFTRSASAARKRLMLRAHLVSQMMADAARLRFRDANTKRIILWADFRDRPVPHTA
jgi:glycosyltransferase involved in cell wall biosynthesis